MDNKIYLITGAAGFLGSHVCDILLERGERIRALVLPGDKSAKWLDPKVEIVYGNLCDKSSMKEFFKVPTGVKSYLIHCASMVVVNPEFNHKVMDVNVKGTENIIELCLKHPELQKVVYVSSTGAIPELPKGQAIKEVDKFLPIDEDKQKGCYSWSKAVATQAVLDAVKKRGLKACIVHPAGILGPKDYAIGTTTKTVIELMKGEMAVGMGGSFNICDVRDLANGCVAALEKGRIGECYILANKLITFKELCNILNKEYPCDIPSFFLPLSIAKVMARIMEKRAKKTGKSPLMTSFSVYNLARNNTYDYSKAVRELGYRTRPYEETLRDMVSWIKENHLLFQEQKTVPLPNTREVAANS